MLHLNMSTPVLFDFVPSAGLYNYLINSVLLNSPESAKLAYVVPAFESFDYNFKYTKTKSELITNWEKNFIVPFRSKEWPQGHNVTNFLKWKTSQTEYEVTWKVDFEPYVIINKKLSPKYDKRFVGFGWNKVSYTMELNQAGFKFIVLPYAFIVHFPHSPSIDITEYRTSIEYRKCLKSLKDAFVKEIKQKYS